jgi:hypothetical protein
VGGEARHQRDVHAEAAEVGQLDVEERQVTAVEHGRERLHLRAEARRHAACEHHGSQLAVGEEPPAERLCALALRRAPGGQRMRHVVRRHLDRLADPVQALELGPCRCEARPQLLERHAVEAEARQQRGELRRDRRVPRVRHGAP